MKVLVVGSGGREHALAWKLHQSDNVSQIYCAPGNPGTARIGTNVRAKSVIEITTWLRSNPVDLVVIGPDNYLAEGLADAVQALDIPVFGPTKAAAEIEWSKSFAKALMTEEGIPTATFRTFTDAQSAREYARSCAFPQVVKADGLAAGKGVIIATTLEEVERAIAHILEDHTFGQSGKTIIIEEFLEGLEISIHAFCDGETAVLFPASKDHKRIFDGDKGPNTGGMGTVAPLDLVREEDMQRIREQIVVPTLRALAKRGRTFKGVLYPGIMLTKDGPKVIEFNARFGDPETQSYMRLLDSDLFDVLQACATGSLTNIDIRWKDEYACCIVLASKGYPDAPEIGHRIEGLKEDGVVVPFHAGTHADGEKIVTAGGRVLGVTAVGSTLREALASAYHAVENVSFEGKQFRHDIGATVL